MQEIPATNSQNMNTTTTVKKVWIVRDDDDENWTPFDDQMKAEVALDEMIVECSSDDEKEYRINNEYGSITIGSYCYDAYDIANNEGIVDEVFSEIIEGGWVPYVNDYGETAENEYSDNFHIVVGMAIEESNGDVHYIKDIDDYNGMSDPTELTDTEGNEWTVIVHDDGTLTASRKVEEPENQYYIYVIGVKDGFPYQTTCSYDTEDEFTHGLIKLVEQGYTTVGNIGRLGCITQTTVVKEMTN